MPFCTQCGVENPASARFCDQCGSVLIHPHAGAPPRATVPVPVPAPVPAPAAVAMTCPQCATPALPGEAFCDNCGAPLLGTTQPAAVVPQQQSFPPPQPQRFAPAPQPVAPPVPQPSAPQPVAPRPQPVIPPPAARTSLAPATLTAVSGGAVIALPAAAQATVGRADPVSQFVPEVDLTPNGALERGVGRRHARFVIHQGAVAVEDMDSTNGTFVNGQKLTRSLPHILRDGDQVQFGQIAFIIKLG